MRTPVFQSDHNMQSSGKWAFLDPDPCVYNRKKEKNFISRYLMITAIKILMLISSLDKQAYSGIPTNMFKLK